MVHRSVSGGGHLVDELPLDPRGGCELRDDLVHARCDPLVHVPESFLFGHREVDAADDVVAVARLGIRTRGNGELLPRVEVMEVAHYRGGSDVEGDPVVRRGFISRLYADDFPSIEHESGAEVPFSEFVGEPPEDVEGYMGKGTRRRAKIRTL